MELQIMIGHVLRETRKVQGRSLRDVATAAHIGYSYLSEVERGKKPIASELLWAVCQALGLPLSVLLDEVSDLLETAERRELVYA